MKPRPWPRGVGTWEGQEERGSETQMSKRPAAGLGQAGGGPCRPSDSLAAPPAAERGVQAGGSERWALAMAGRLPDGASQLSKGLRQDAAPWLCGPACELLIRVLDVLRPGTKTGARKETGVPAPGC